MNQINIAVNLFSLHDRHDDRTDFRPVFSGQGREHLAVVGVRGVQLTYKEGDRPARLFRVYVGQLRPDRKPGFSRKDDQCRVGGGQRLGHAAGKVKEAGGVDQIQLFIPIFHRIYGGRNRNLPPLFFRIKIHGQRAVGIFADPLEKPRRKQQSVGQRALT